MTTQNVMFQLSDTFYKKLTGQVLKTYEVLEKGVVVELSIELKKTEDGINVNLLDEDGDIIATRYAEWSNGDSVIIADIKSLTSIVFP